MDVAVWSFKTKDDFELHVKTDKELAINLKKEKHDSQRGRQIINLPNAWQLKWRRMELSIVMESGEE